MTKGPQKSNRQLNPIQLKKSLRPSSNRTSINCDTQPQNTEKNLQTEYKEVYNFLKDLGMENYLEQFVKNGIVNEEKILYLNNDNLKLISVPYAHRVRFLKKLKEIETLQIMKKSITEKGGLSKIKLKKSQNVSKYEEIFIPKEEDDLEIGEEEQRQTFTQAIFDFQKSHSKYNFNENLVSDICVNNNKDNNNVCDINTSKNKNNSSGKTITKTVETETNTSFNNDKKVDDKNEEKESQIDKSKNQPIEIGEYIESKNKNKLKISGIQQLLPVNKSKTLCYNCLHMILQEQCIQKYKKPFCSLHCIDVFESKNITNCGNCKKTIEIGRSIHSFFKEKVYYCCYNCLQMAEPNENIRNNTSQVIGPGTLSPSSSDTSENPVDILDL